MKISLVAVGRMKAGPERDLAQRYRERVGSLARGLGFGAFETIELAEDRARSGAARRGAEAAAILERVAGGELVVFDERGGTATSLDFAGRLGSWRDAGRPKVSLVIGGPDGLDAACRERASLCLSFGRMTMPHQLVRILVAEQLYRAMTILAGHPYHREGDGRGDGRGDGS